MFIRRLLSHLITACAVFFLVSTYFIWVVDATFLNAKTLNKALVSAGVPSAIATALPEKLAEGDSSKPTDPEIKARLTQVVTPEYIEKKLKESTTAIIAFVRSGEPQPAIDLKDFVKQVRDAGIEISDAEAANIAKPIELNQFGGLNNIPKYYQNLQLVKYFGILLFLLLVGIEWFVAEKGKKLRRVGRIFLHAGLWFLLFWTTTVLVPSRVLDQLAKYPDTASVQKVGIATVKAMHLMLTPQLLGAAVVCLVIAGIIYIVRHGKKHLQTIQEVPKARIRSSAMAKMPTRN